MTFKSFRTSGKVISSSPSPSPSTPIDLLGKRQSVKSLPMKKQGVLMDQSETPKIF
ncbi:1276_t:CDS:2 [Funneliformis mosseae]|uniref:1276_t:CDS:1 n=1 Tax=Funneliformis mosseae TaxID=27381 RepID=A0A9N9F8J7_FUNMO|nr:1276_t:CDS:2 [Funneliformis mosseae]